MEFLKRQGIKQATIVIAAATVLSQLLGLIRESIIARFLGTSAEYDILLVAMAIPLTIAGLLFQSIPSAGIPYLSWEGRSGINGGLHCTSGRGFLTTNSIVILALTALAFLTIPLFRPLLADGMTPAAADRVIILGRIFCLLIPLRAYEAVYRSLLHIRKHFLFPAMAVLGFNITIIMILLTLYPQLGSVAFVIAWLAGMLMQMLMVIVPSWLMYSQTEKVSSNKIDSSGYLKFLGIIVVIEAITVLIDPFDRYLCGLTIEAGHVSAVNYASIIYQAPMRVLMFSVATALFPSIAEKAADNDRRGLAALYHRAIGLAVMVIVPVAVYFIIFRHEIVRILFERGQFNALSRQMTTEVLVYYLAGLLTTSLFYVQARVVYSLKMWKILLVSRPLALVVKVIIGITFIKTSWALAIGGGTIALYVLAFLGTEIYLVIVADLKYNRKDLCFLSRTVSGAALTVLIIVTIYWFSSKILFPGDIATMALCALGGALTLAILDRSLNISGIRFARKRN
jgi:putative peptidoglycan lipid II flippase